MYKILRKTKTSSHNFVKKFLNKNAQTMMGERKTIQLLGFCTNLQ